MLKSVTKTARVGWKNEAKSSSNCALQFMTFLKSIFNLFSTFLNH